MNASDGSTRVAKVVLVGDTGVGKTSIVTNFVTGQFDKFAEPTIGAAYHSKIMKTPQGEVKFQIWDTAGQEKYHSLIPMYYRGAYAAIIVYDVCRKSSFDMLGHWHEELTKTASSDVKIVIAGNKADNNENRQVDREVGERFAQDIEADFFEVSAKEGSNIRELFKSVADSLPPLDTNKDDTNDDALALGGDDSSKGNQKKCC
eukprot:gb/GECG01001340.1/.p1 GENE.gb/GECG01001340.1/~~gb/GECG01001340.1/.p1  ORF type:complete len:203 (+),score=35.40 gb/GECG01001340.1/:1-609(+)